MTNDEVEPEGDTSENKSFSSSEPPDKNVVSMNVALHLYICVGTLFGFHNKLGYILILIISTSSLIFFLVL